MSNLCTPILVGMASPVSEILPLFRLLSKWPKFPFRPWTIVHGHQKIESAQKIHASRGWWEMHANQVWWAWSLRLWRLCCLSLLLVTDQVNVYIEGWNVIASSYLSYLWSSRDSQGWYSREEEEELLDRRSCSYLLLLVGVAMGGASNFACLLTLVTSI